MMTADIFILLGIYQIKHFLADYPLQTPYMLQKFKADWGFFKPLAAHCGVHALFTFCITMAWGWSTMPMAAAFVLAALDFVVHFTMDRIKAGPKYLGRFEAMSKTDFMYHQELIKRATDKESIYDCYNAETDKNAAMKSNKYFWWSLGLDQGVHHLTHYVIIYFLMTWRV